MTADLHRPKHEVFDVPAMTNTDPKGFVRPVEEYRITDYGLYMSRTADHPRFTHLESWLLPALGLRANIFHFVPGYRESQRLYVDVGEFTGPDEKQRWHAVDWYLDLVDAPGEPLDLIDVDELFEAMRRSTSRQPTAKTRSGSRCQHWRAPRRRAGFRRGSTRKSVSPYAGSTVNSTLCRHSTDIPLILSFLSAV